jgi:DNA-binding Lrp family transcriptional regulator
LDRLDVSILRELTQAGKVLPGRPGVGPSNREISRKLGLPPATINYRIRRMYSSGVLRGSSILLNPRLVGLRYGAYVVDVSALLDKPSVVDRLKRVEGALYIHDFVNSLVWVGVAYEDDWSLESKLAVIREIVGAEGVFSSIPYPPPRGSISRSEAKLALRLLRRGFTSYGELAKALGVSLRTLQRQLSKLVGEGAVYSLPRVDYRAMTNCVPVDLNILFKDAETGRTSAAKVLPVVGDYLVFAALWDTLGMCSLILPDVETMYRIAATVKHFEGVASARVDIVREHIDQASMLAPYVERWLESGGFGRRGT